MQGTTPNTTQSATTGQETAAMMPLNSAKSYETTLPQKSYVVCGAKKRDGQPCQKPPVDGWNRCRLHGAGAGRPRSNGAAGKDFLIELRRNGGYAGLVARYENDPELLDLRSALAVVRANIDVLIHATHDRIEANTTESLVEAHSIMLVANETAATFATIAERHARIENAHALTQAHVNLINIEFVRIIAVLPPEMQRAVLEAMKPCLMLQAPADLTALDAS